MLLNVSAPWHKSSYEALLNERLPQLLAERLPLVAYDVASTGTYTCRVTVALGTASGALDVAFDVPQPDATGLFKVGDVLKVVLPVADHEKLDKATIRCVGEQLYDDIAARLGQAPPDLPWDIALARAWLPLDTWIGDFLEGTGERFPTPQPIDHTNWLAYHTHLRRLIVPERDDVIAPGQLGRVCPFEMPEGPNIGHIFTIAVGAEIREGKIVIVDDRPEATLGLSASMIPFLEHDDPNQLLMGANMLRQWIPQQTPEPALVQSGNEPNPTLVPEFWAGRNLLTAFVSWGAGTFEDGIVVSESCAQRFDAPYPLHIGDKMSNRHGTKSVVGQILPDDQMPHMPDGTPVDLIYNFANLHRRMNFGQIREAVMGYVAYTTGEPAIVPPFAAPTAEALRDRLAKAGLPESGMETLTLSKDGSPLERPSTVGWVYWGRLSHLAKDKLHTFTTGEWGQVQGEMENFMLRDMGAFENIRENLNTRSVRRPDAATLTARVVAGPIEQAPPPTPMFLDLVRRLRVAGIEAALEGDKLAFHFAAPQENALKLARPVPHPWLRERLLNEIDLPDTIDNGEYTVLIKANDRLARMLTGHTPQKLVDDAIVQLEKQVQAFFDALLTPTHLRLSERLNFSARTVLVPGDGLTLEQVGLPDAMAWALFGPLVVHELGGDEDAVSAHNKRAAQALDALMARSWVIVNRAPTVMPTALLAFHPVRVPDDALHLHPLVCKWLNADFDGDQAAVLLPITEAAQHEAGEKLSVTAHLTRDPGLLADLLPPLDALWGLSKLSLHPEGLAEIAQIVGEPVTTPGGFITQTSLAGAMDKVLAREGVEAVLPIVERLMQRGFEVAKASGASLSPFAGTNIAMPPQPSGEEPDRWTVYAEALREAIAANADYGSTDLGPQLLMIKAREKGLKALTVLLGGRGTTEDAHGRTVIVRHGNVDGYTSEEMFACVAGARRGLAQMVREWEQMGQTFRERNVSRSFNVLTRALRTKHPGLVFARAAANEEIDPLTDVESRLLIGLPVK